MNIKQVPAYLEIDGEKVEVGTALIDIDMGTAEISVSMPMTEEVRDKLASATTVGGVSLGDI